MSQSDKAANPAPPASVAPPGPVQPPLTPRLALGICGLYVGAMMGGLNNRLGVLGLDDLRGVLGFAYDDASWISSFYSAGELVIMPFVVWLVTIFSMKRLALATLTLAMGLAAILPFIQNLNLLITLRFIQGMACGLLIFIFMVSLFMLLPAHIRMYGFGFYAMTATFTPNVGLWFTALCTDLLHGWELLYWHSIPLGILAMLLVKHGLPDGPLQPGRLKTTNWLGMALIVPGAVLLALGMSQGVRLEWFDSPFVTWSVSCGLLLIVLYAVCDWHHPNPFLQLKVFISHRNVWLALLILLGMLTVGLAGSMLPVGYLGRIWDYRPLQSASVGLVIALPQFIIGPLVAYLLYRRWLDARLFFISGLLLLALGCYLGSGLDREWIAEQFWPAQAAIALGQPMAMISAIFMTSNNIPMLLGPSLGGAINTLRCLGVILGNAVVAQYLQARQTFHYEGLRNHSSVFNNALFPLPEAQLARIVNSESYVTAVSDAYSLLGLLALVLAGMVLFMRYTPPPAAPAQPVDKPGRTGKASVKGEVRV